MPSAQRVVAVLVGGLAFGGCGSAVTPKAGSGTAGSPLISRGQVDDQRTAAPNHLACLRQDHLRVVEIGATRLQIGSPPGGPTVRFEPTPGIAEGDIIQGYRWAQGAELIGSALLYPNQASDPVLRQVESCLSQGVAEPNSKPQ